MPAWGLAALTLGAAALVALVALRGRVRIVVAAIVGATAVAAAVVGLFPEETAPPMASIAPAPAERPAVPEPAAAGSETALLLEAELLLNRGDTPAAAALYQEARASAERRGDVLAEASAVFGLGRLEHLTGQGDAARARYGEALALYRAGESAVQEARVLATMGDLEKDTFQWAPAAAYYREARAVWDGLAEPKKDSHIVLNLTATPTMPDGEAASRKVLEEAELLYGNLDDVLGIADVKALTAELDWVLGNAAPARAGYGEATILYQRAGAPLRQAMSVLAITEIDLAAGANLLAARGAEAAAALFADAEDAAGVALTRRVHGDVERLQGRMEAAREHYAAAAAALRALGDPQTAQVLLALGEVHWFLGERDPSLAASEEALDLFRARQDRAGEAAASLLTGQLLAESLDPAARPLLDASAEYFSAAGDPHGEGRAHLARARWAAAQGDAEGAADGFRLAAERFEEATVPWGRMLAFLGLGDLLRDADAAEAAAAYRASADLADAMASSLADANRFLGLPPVDVLALGEHAAGNEYGSEEANALAAEDLVARAAENVAAFPDHNAEARSLVAETEPRLAAAAAFARGG